MLLVYEASHRSSIRTQQSVVCYINNTCVYVTVLSVLQVVMKLVRLLPDGHRMKREVDLALDSVSETMTPLHYHLREVIICSYRQVEGAPSSQTHGPVPNGTLNPCGLPRSLLFCDVMPFDCRVEVCCGSELAEVRIEGAERLASILLNAK